MQHYHAIHYSGNTFMPVEQYAKDVRWLLARGPHLIALTEAGEPETMAAIRNAVNGRMQVINPDIGDIAFLLSHQCTLRGSGGPLALPAQSGPAALGGHGPRRNSFVQFDLGDEIITHTSVHFVTAHEHHASGGQSRVEQQLKQAELMGIQMEHFGKGSGIATGSGDLNTVLPVGPVQDVFDKYHLTTTAVETKTFDPTHGDRRIDYVWTRDLDLRVRVSSMKILKSRIVNSDHDPVEAHMDIRPIVRRR